MSDRKDLKAFVESLPIDAAQKAQAARGIDRLNAKQAQQMTDMAAGMLSQLPAAASAANALRLARAEVASAKVTLTLAQKLGVSESELRSALGESLEEVGVLLSSDNDIGAVMRVVCRPANETPPAPPTSARGL